MADNQKQDANVKGHQKEPQQRFVFADRRKQKRVMQRPKPPGFFLGIDLQSSRMAGLSKDFYQADSGADKKSCKSDIDHRHQYDVIQRIQRSLL